MSGSRWHATAHVGASVGQVELVDPEACDLMLTVSNQSYLDDPVVLTIVIDGVEVVSQPFEDRNQHHLSAFRCTLVRAHTGWRCPPQVHDLADHRAGVRFG